ncbi:hypothetical protein P5673_023145 [Acropora cervicornis]|uniref:Uncharacterized protein n=1 Tax=Acropora cervicornis TaxID=6130 RepID=A0AAD9UYY8_ACRCE|nr:hypothetical protein P5673_023145 [Acropora cervicornis]
MQADQKLVSCTKRLYGMNSSKLVESIARAEKLSLLVLGNTLGFPPLPSKVKPITPHFSRSQVLCNPVRCIGSSGRPLSCRLHNKQEYLFRLY